MQTQTATQPAKLVNWNSVKPTCACGRKSYCDNSCNTFARIVSHKYPMPAEDESFADWQDRRTTNGGR
jgi:hypothetical protein